MGVRAPGKSLNLDTFLAGLSGRAATIGRCSIDSHADLLLYARGIAQTHRAEAQRPGADAIRDS
eukprot:13593013-Alexandrium_andersonii.AAC.1